MAALVTFGIVAYPVLVYFALGVASPRAIALCTLAALVLRVAASSPARLWAFARVFAPAGLALAATSLVALVSSDPRALLLEPAVSNFALLGAWAWSLVRGPSAVERLARSQVGELPPDEVRYCRRVTALWCGFFLANGAACAAFALLESREAWALYTGGVAYVWIGALFTGEYVYRHWRFRRYLGARTDGVLRRLFPPP